MEVMGARAFPALGPRQGRTILVRRGVYPIWGQLLLLLLLWDAVGAPFRFIFLGAMDWLELISSSARALGLGVAGAAVNLSSAPALSAEDISGLVLQSILLGCILHVCPLHEACAHRADARHELHGDLALR